MVSLIRLAGSERRIKKGTDSVYDEKGLVGILRWQKKQYHLLWMALQFLSCGPRFNIL